MKVLPRREEWPALVFAAIAASIWTILSMFGLFAADVWIDTHTLGGWLRIIVLLPGVLSVAAAAALSQWGLRSLELGVLVGAAVAVVLLGSITLAVLRKT